MNDWGEIGNLILRIILCFKKRKKRFAAEAKARGITVDQLMAAAIAEAIREQVESVTACN